MNRMFKFVSLFFVISLLLIGPVFSQFNLTKPLSFMADNGDEEEYIEVENATQLQEVNEKSDGLYILTNNIDLNELDKWLPIGTEDTPFSGELLGNGYSISNMDPEYESSETSGLIESMTKDAIVDVEVEFSEEVSKEELDEKNQELEADITLDKEENELDEPVESVEEILDLKEKKDSKDSSSMDVSNWGEFVEAMADDSVNEVSLTSDIVRDSTSTPKTSVSKIVNGNGYSLSTDGGNYGIDLEGSGQAKEIDFYNIILDKTGGSGYIVNASSSWTVNLTDVVKKGARGLVSGNDSKVNIKGDFEANEGSYNMFSVKEIEIKDSNINTTGVNSTIFSADRLNIKESKIVDKTKSGNTMFETATINIDNASLEIERGRGNVFTEVKDFSMKNNSLVKANTERVFLSAVADSNITIDSGSKMDVYGEERMILDTLTTHLTVKGKGTELNISGNSSNTGNDGALVSVNGDGSTINVDDQAVINVHSKQTVAMLMNSYGGKFNVTNNSQINLRSDNNSNTLGATLRFRSAGNMEFNVGSKSEINIHKTGGSAPAVRMYGGNNKFIVHTGGQVNIKNNGAGSASNGGSSANNQGIYYTTGGNNLFSLEDKESEINIIADRGPALDMGGNSGTIEAGPDTVFRAEGRTSSVSGGIFNAGVAKIMIDKPLFYDFRNNRSGGGNVFNVSNGSSFKSLKSDLSVWEKGSNLDGDPSGNWPLFDYELGSVNFRDIVSSNVPDFNSSVYEGADKYSRMSGNNASPVIDETRIPTDADKFLFGHATVPIGNENEGRDAWTDEVHVILEYENSKGDIEQIQASTIGMDKDNSGLSIYGEKPRAGMFKASIPEEKFTELGDKFRVVKAWRGMADPDSDRVHVSSPEDLKAPERKTIDVTPPVPVKLLVDTDNISGYKEITNATKRIEGLGTEDNTIGKLEVNNKLTDSQVNVNYDKSFIHNLTNYLKKDDLIRYRLLDKAKYYTAEEVGFELPSTHTKTGNINPVETFDYHDAQFLKAEEIKVLDVLPKPEITQSVKVSNDKAEIEEDFTRVGSTLSYNFKIKNNGVDNSEYNSVIFTTEVDKGLKVDLNSVKLNGEKLDSDLITLDKDTNMLRVNLKDTLSSLKESILTYDTEVLQSLEGKTVCNKGSIAGDTVRENKFEIGKPNLSLDREVKSADSNEVCNPGGEIQEALGELEFISAPENLKFTAKISSKNEEFFVDKSSFNKPLLIMDDRPKKGKWELQAKMLEELTSEDGKKDLTGALIYRTEYKDQVLSEGTVLIHSENYEENKDREEFNLSDKWSESEEGLFLQLKPGDATKQTYKGKVQWNLVDAP